MSTADDSIASTLAHRLSTGVSILTNADLEAFQDRLQRWSDIGRETPSAIVLPQNEEDCRQTVAWAASTATPFVVKSGGMSLYSTIGKPGIIIDLSEFAGVQHDKHNGSAILQGGVLSKTVAMELAKDGCCTPLPSANSVGAIPFFLNGGNSPLLSQIGYASDQILSARMISAKGELVVVDEAHNPDLLYALRGAGQYFGLVTELTVRTFPVSQIFKNPEGKLWTGRFVFPLDRALDVCGVMREIANDARYSTGGLVMVAAPPPHRKPALVVSAKLISDDEDSSLDALQQQAFRALYELDPIVAGGSCIPFENNGDTLQVLCAAGDFKKLVLTGLYDFEPELFTEVVEIWQSLTASCPDAVSSLFSIQWESRPAPRPAFESANSMHGMRLWANNLIWHKNPENVAEAQRHLERAIAAMRAHQELTDFVDFANSPRTGPIEHQYQGKARLERLSEIKRSWDATGLFGQEFLKNALREKSPNDVATDSSEHC